MKPNHNNCSDIKGLRFFTKEICPYTLKKTLGEQAFIGSTNCFP